MEFHYIIEDSICISENDLNFMAEQVKRGMPIGEVVDEYISGFDDYDYYHSFAYEDRVIDEVRKRVRALKGE